jgi:phage gp46-like protein
VEDGVASGVQVTASTDASRDLLALEVVVVRSAQPQARYRFEAFWKGA